MVRAARKMARPLTTGGGRATRSLAASAGDLEDAVAVVVAMVADLGIEGFGNPEAAEGEQADEGRERGVRPVPVDSCF